MRKKNVLFATVTVDVMGPPDSSENRIRTAEETVLEALRHLARDFKSNAVPRGRKDFCSFYLMTKEASEKEGNVLASKANTRYRYPGDEVIYKAIGETLRAARLESGMSVEQAEEAFRELQAKTDFRATYRALGLAVKEERERQSISRVELSRMSGLRLRDLILLERGQLSRLPAAYFFRISYALKISPAVLARRFEAIQENITRSRQKA